MPLNELLALIKGVPLRAIELAISVS